MKKVICAIVMGILLVTSVFALSEEITPYGNPDNTLDSPRTLPYSSSFSFKNGSTTDAIKRTARSITVRLDNTYLTTSRSAKISIRAYYWNGSTWSSADSDSVVINNIKKDYSVVLSIPSGSAFYVRLSKSDYEGYYAKGTLEISAN